MSRNTLVILWMALLALSLRPVAPIERAAEWLSVPMRLVSALAAPLNLSRTAQAGSEEDQALAQSARQLLQREQASVVPADPSLVQERNLIHAEIVDRGAAGEDRLIVRHAAAAPVQVGLPVVAGSAYVGRVIEVGRAGTVLLPGEARIELITREDARVEARTQNAVLILGGLCSQSRDGARARQLAVHAQQGELVPGETVRVGERVDPMSGAAVLANGYTIGTLVPRPHGGREGWSVAPVIDYRGGLGQVLILAPQNTASAADLLVHDPLERAGWFSARLALAATPCFWRETRRLHAGTRQGLSSGACVAARGHYLGRLEQTEWLVSDVRLLEDPGSSVLVLADFGGEDAPLHLGLLHTRSFDRATGRLELEWQAGVEALRQVALRRNRRVDLYTGSGDRWVPAGLRIGSTELSASRTEQLLVITRPAWVAGTVEVDVWRPQQQESGS
jgi:cell shape-determining protein MreC